MRLLVGDELVFGMMHDIHGKDGRVANTDDSIRWARGASERKDI